MNAVRPKPSPAPAMSADPPLPVKFDKEFSQLVKAATTPPPPEHSAPVPEPARRPAYQYD